MHTPVVVVQEPNTQILLQAGTVHGRGSVELGQHRLLDTFHLAVEMGRAG